MRKFSALLLVGLVAAFALGLARLYRLRFETGDVYPPYSSLRADPLGAKALFDSLGRLVAVERNYRPLPRFEAPGGATLFWLGLEPRELEFSRPEIERLETFVAGGGRLVMALMPVADTPRFFVFPRPLPGRVRQQDTNQEDTLIAPVALTNRWQFSLAYLWQPRDKQRVHQPAAVSRQPDSALPEMLDVHTALGFRDLGELWTTVYARTNDHAVVIERPLGRGSIVLLADAYPFSNEALLKDRHPALLAWLVGSSRQAVFDEAHLGVEENPGVATLARRYRLHAFFAALLALAGLYVWKNSSSLLPLRPAGSDADTDAVAGRDSAAGFVNLLRRSIPRDQLLATCLEQWNADCLRMARPSQHRLEQMQAIIDAQNALPPRQRDAVATYREFVRILRRRAHPTSSSEAQNPRLKTQASKLEAPDTRIPR